MAMHNPLHPGEFIKGVYLDPFGIKSQDLAKRLKVSPSTVRRLLNGETRVSPEMALKLSRVLGRSPESWMAMQDNYELWQAKSRIDLDELEPFAFPAA